MNFCSTDELPSVYNKLHITFLLSRFFMSNLRLAGFESPVVKLQFSFHFVYKIDITSMLLYLIMLVIVLAIRTAFDIKYYEEWRGASENKTHNRVISFGSN